MSQRGITVCLTNTAIASGYLATYRENLKRLLGSKIDVQISTVDTDPIDIWQPSRVI